MRLIDADALYKELNRPVIMRYVPFGPWDDGWDNALDTATELLNNAPTVEAQAERRGRWNNGRCTNCGFDLRTLTDGESDLEQWVWDDGLDFCPDCGAKMSGGNDNA